MTMVLFACSLICGGDDDDDDGGGGDDDDDDDGFRSIDVLLGYESLNE